jgi:hypothetical protein
MPKLYRLALPPQMLTRGFWIYVFRISREGKPPCFYVGMTGDRGSFVAQSPFNRIAAHLDERLRPPAQWGAGVVQASSRVEQEYGSPKRCVPANVPECHAANSWHPRLSAPERQATVSPMKSTIRPNDKPVSRIFVSCTGKTRSSRARRDKAPDIPCPSNAFAFPVRSSRRCKKRR